MDSNRLAALTEAMEQEASPDQRAIANCLTRFHRRMDPTERARACGSCGCGDIPAPSYEGDAEAIGITSFTDVPLPNLTQREGHHCHAESGGRPCGIDCPYLFVPLEYTDDNETAYNAVIPEHIQPPLELTGDDLDAWQQRQHDDWLEFRPVISMVQVDGNGNAVSRIGFTPTYPYQLPTDLTG